MTRKNRMHRKHKKLSLPDFDLNIALTLITDFNALILDVRTYEEFCQIHLKGAILVPTPTPPLSKQEKHMLKTQLQYVLRQETRNKQHPIVIYCKKGIRAKAAKQIIEKLGYIHVTVLGGVEEPPLQDIINNHKHPARKILKPCNCLKHKNTNTLIH